MYLLLQMRIYDRLLNRMIMRCAKAVIMLQQTLKLFAINLGIMLLISLVGGLAMTRDVTLFALPIPFLLFLAITVTVFAALFNFLRLRRISYRATTDKYSAIQRTSTTVLLHQQQAIARIRRYCDDHFWQIVNEDKLQGRLRIKTPPTVFSWGEKIEILAKEHGNGLTQITIVSKPRFPLVVMDFGSSLTTVGSIVAMLQEPTNAVQS